jgi:hypothetical protein
MRRSRNLTLTPMMSNSARTACTIPASTTRQLISICLPSEILLKKLGNGTSLIVVTRSPQSHMTGKKNLLQDFQYKLVADNASNSIVSAVWTQFDMFGETEQYGTCSLVGSLSPQFHKHDISRNPPSPYVSAFL